MSTYKKHVWGSGIPNRKKFDEMDSEIQRLAEGGGGLPPTGNLHEILKVGSTGPMWGKADSDFVNYVDTPTHENGSVGAKLSELSEKIVNIMTAQILVTAPIGTSITVTNGTTTYTATATSTTTKINVNDYGTWIVTMVSGDETRTRTVSVDTVKQYSSLWSRLPNVYQEVEYIESTGTQYLFADTKANGIEITFAYSDTSNYTGCIFGTSHSQYWILFNAYNNKWQTIYGDSEDSSCSWVGAYNSADTNVHTVQLGQFINGLTFDGETKQISLGTPSDNWISLFAFNENGTMVYKANAKIYSCKLYDDSTIIRNLIPCYHKDNEVIGMYDTITNTFFTNSGTGTFIKGDDV